MTTEEMEALERANDFNLLDYHHTGMCLWRIGEQWHITPGPQARVSRSGDGWAGTLPEVVDTAIEELRKQNRLPREEEATNGKD